jgi:hypothetical protein
MWGFAHLVDLAGASLVTTAPQKGKGASIGHNVAPAFGKRRRRRASAGGIRPRIDMLPSISPTDDFRRLK